MIEPRYATLQTLFADRVFRIPHYQRFYSWQAKQRQDLFSDLRKLGDRGNDNPPEDAIELVRRGHHREATTLALRLAAVLDLHRHASFDDGVGEAPRRIPRCGLEHPVPATSRDPGVSPDRKRAPIAEPPCNRRASAR